MIPGRIFHLLSDRGKRVADNTESLLHVSRSVPVYSDRAHSAVQSSHPLCSLQPIPVEVVAADGVVKLRRFLR